MAYEQLNPAADNRIENTRSAVEGLLTLSDSKQSARMIAELVTRHAPSLAEWAGRCICRKLMDCTERRAALAALNAAFVPPSTSLSQIRPIEPTVEELAEAFGFLVDPELYRVAIALKHGIHFTVWAVATELSRRHGGHGWVETADLMQTFKTAGSNHTKQYIHRNWLKPGAAMGFWRIDGSRIYLCGYHKLIERLTAEAVDTGNEHLVSTNAPGSKFIFIPLGAKPVEIYGYALAAWHNSRGHHTQNISRYTLEKLWANTKKTLINWEKAVGIEATKCYAVFAADSEHLPAHHAYPTLHVVELAEGGTDIEVRATARHSNIYQAPSMKERQHKRTPREARRAARRVIDIHSQNGTRNGIYGRPEAKADGVAIKPTKRRNFYALDGQLQNAFKRLRKHTQHHEERAPHFVAVAYNKRRDRWTFEQCSDGFQHTSAGDRLPRRHEDHYFAKLGGRGAYVAAWRSFAV